MVEITYYSISMFKMVTEKGIKIWIDPCITQNKHSPINLNDVKEADILLLSHSSWDHVGTNPDGTCDAFEIAKKTGAIVVGPDNVAAMARNYGIPSEQIKKAGVFSGEVSIKDVRIKGIESHHGLRLAKSEEEWVLGHDQGFVLTLEDNVRIYHSGDTCTFLDLRYSVGELYRPNIMMLEAGATRGPGAASVTNPFEVATAVRWIGPDVFIPMHDPYNVFTEKVAEYVKMAAPHVQVVLMKPGETIRYKPYEIEKI